MHLTPSARRILAAAVLLAASLALLSACAQRKVVGSGGSTSASGTSGSSSTSATQKSLAPTRTPVAVPATILEPPAYGGYEPLPIFTYHTVDPKLKNAIAITPAVFEAQLKVLRDLGYHPITARELVQHQTQGTALPSKPVMITFDDGWRNQFTYAAPLLRKYGFKATFFINPQPIGKAYPGYLTRDMVLALAKDGNDIESHTWRHLTLIRNGSQSAATFQDKNMSQLTLATDWIRKVVGQQPVALCYPFGFYDTEAIGMAQRAGYKAGFTVDEGVADARPWDAFGLKRFTIDPSQSLDSFKQRLASGPLPITDIQPPPATRVVGITTTVTVDITDMPRSINGFTMTSGPSMHSVQIVERNGRRYATALIRKAKTGLRVVIAKGRDASGRYYVTSWVLVLGDPPQSK